MEYFIAFVRALLQQKYLLFVMDLKEIGLLCEILRHVIGAFIRELFEMVTSEKAVGAHCYKNIPSTV